MKNLSKLFSGGVLASELAILVWLYSYLMEVGIAGALRGFLFHTFLLWVVFAAVILLKKRAETHAWPKWTVKLLRVATVPAYIYDCWFNARYGTLAFLEFSPVRVLHILGVKVRHRFEPFTRRLQRHYQKSGWRGNEARLFCWLVHKVDKGHCL